jgi:hypothetical protein
LSIHSVLVVSSLSLCSFIKSQRHFSIPLHKRPIHVLVAGRVPQTIVDTMLVKSVGLFY